MIRYICILLSFQLYNRTSQYNYCDNRYDKSGNEQFVTELSKWIFHERGHLKVGHNFLAVQPSFPSVYANIKSFNAGCKRETPQGWTDR